MRNVEVKHRHKNASLQQKMGAENVKMLFNGTLYYDTSLSRQFAVKSASAFLFFLSGEFDDVSFSSVCIIAGG